MLCSGCICMWSHISSWIQILRRDERWRKPDDILQLYKESWSRGDSKCFYQAVEFEPKLESIWPSANRSFKSQIRQDLGIDMTFGKNFLLWHWVQDRAYTTKRQTCWERTVGLLTGKTVAPILDIVTFNYHEFMARCMMTVTSAAPRNFAKAIMHWYEIG